MGRPVKDLTGQTFGKLTVVERAENSKHNQTQYRCKCDCGTETKVLAANLVSSKSKGCGCVRNSKTKERNKKNTKHGKANTRAYRILAGVKARCLNPNHTAYRSYGGRGIKLCKEYLTFENFLKDLGEPPDNHSLDRIDVNGHYSCGHCDECLANGWKANLRWATAKQQSRNLRSNKLVTYNGKTKCISEWAESYCLPRERLWHRLKSGWNMEKALTTPIDARFNSRKTSPAKDTAKSAVFTERIELSTIRDLETYFDNLTFIKQYRVKPYWVDCYLQEHSIAIECDERGHRRYANGDYEQRRQAEIEALTGCTFIRYNPHAKGFDILDVIQQIENAIAAQTCPHANS